MRTRRAQRGGSLRVAILFYGRVNAYEKVLDSLNKLKVYSPTLFCSLNRSGETPYIKQFLDTFGMTKEQYSLESTIVPPPFTTCRKNPESHYLNTYSLFYHLQKAYALADAYQKARGQPFDVIVAYRADIQAADAFPLKAPLPHTIYIPEGNDYQGISGMMAYGDPEAMRKYCSVEKHLMEYCNRVSVNHEVILKTHLHDQGLRIERFPFAFSLHPSRHNAHYNQLGGAHRSSRLWPRSGYLRLASKISPSRRLRGTRVVRRNCS